MNASMTAAQVAVALVAACRITGVDPEKVFVDGEGGGRTRVMAAAACVARLNWPKRDAARVFRVHPNRLTPSGQKLARVEVEHLLGVAEALRARGLVDGAGGDPPPSPQPAAEAETPQRKAGAVEKRAGAKRAEAHSPSPTAAPRPRIRPVTTTAKPIVATIPERGGQPTSRGGAMRLKPVNDRIIRWTRQQLSLGADLAFVADCFDVDAEALRQAVEPMEQAA